MTRRLARDPFYTDFANLYDENQKGVRGDIQFYRELGREAGGLVVELGVGTGRVAIPIALDGARVLGLDIATEMLAICRSKASEAGVRLDLAQADMRSFALREPAALVTIPHRAFLHNLTIEDQRSTLEACRRALRRGGRLAMNVFNPEIIALVEWMRGAEAHQGGEDGGVLEHDAVGQVVEMAMTMRVPGGGTKRSVLRVRYLYRGELEARLAECGFEVEAIYGDFSRGRFGPVSTEIVCIARPVPPTISW